MLLEKALPSEEEDPLYLLAFEVEQDEILNAEMKQWDGVPATALNMMRGEVWWVELAPTAGEIRKKRPAIILTVNTLNRARRAVIVAPLSSSAIARPPLVVSVP